MLLLQSEEERTRVDFGRGITAVNKKVRGIAAYDIHHDKNEDEAQHYHLLCMAFAVPRLLVVAVCFYRRY